MPKVVDNPNFGNYQLSISNFQLNSNSQILNLELLILSLMLNS